MNLLPRSPHGTFLPRHGTGHRRPTREADGRRPTVGPGTGGGTAYRNTVDEQRAAARTCAAHARDAADLRVLLAALGLVSDG